MRFEVNLLDSENIENIQLEYDVEYSQRLIDIFSDNKLIGKMYVNDLISISKAIEGILIHKNKVEQSSYKPICNCNCSRSGISGY